MRFSMVQFFSLNVSDYDVVSFEKLLLADEISDKNPRKLSCPFGKEDRFDIEKVCNLCIRNF